MSSLPVKLPRDSDSLAMIHDTCPLATSHRFAVILLSSWRGGTWDRAAAAGGRRGGGVCASPALQCHCVTAVADAGRRWPAVSLASLSIVLSVARRRRRCWWCCGREQPLLPHFRGTGADGCDGTSQDKWSRRLLWAWAWLRSVQERGRTSIPHATPLIPVEATGGLVLYVLYIFVNRLMLGNLVFDHPDWQPYIYLF